ncbi:MAG: DUF1043 family protein [Snodgrassella sp.]|nr:DUF1043 family protein [Snodgrassella sp.]
MSNQLGLYIFIALIIGFAAGAGLMWFIMRSSRSEKKHQQYEAVKASFDQYRQQVDQHFIDTAGVVDEMNRSYQKVLQQLSVDARQLMEHSTIQEQLIKRADKSVTMAFLTETDIGDNHTDSTTIPTYTDVITAEVVPVNGLPDQVPDRIGPKATNRH